MKIMVKAMPINQNDNLARIIDIDNLISVTAHRKQKKDNSVKVLVDEEELISHAADPIENEKDINDMIRYLYMNGNYASMCLFILGINTGYRPVDLVNIRKCDIVTHDGKLKDSIGFYECKTGKVAVMYFNDVVKAAFMWLFSKKNIGYYDYVFVSEGNRKSYLFYDTKNGCIVSEIGNHVVKVAKPIHHNTVSQHLINAAEKLGVTGHFSSYCMRQTFSYHFRRKAVGIDSCSQMGMQQVTLLSHYFNHSKLDVTQQHYVRERRAMKEIVLNMNLGEEAVIGILKD